MGMKEEVVFEGRTTNLILAQTIRLLSDPMMLDVKLVDEYRIYKNGEPISNDQLSQDFRDRYLPTTD